MNELDRMRHLAGMISEKSTSEKQARFMAAAAHDPKFADKVGMDTSVAKEFNAADTGTDQLSNAMKHREEESCMAEEGSDSDVVAQKMERLAQMSAGMMDQEEALVAISRELSDEGYDNDEIMQIMDALETQLHSDHEREEFLNGDEESEDENEICVSCNGSGEGQYDGTRCSSCGGSGVDRSGQDDDDFDIPDEDDGDDYIGPFEEVSMEEDLNNGYEDIHYAKGSDYFPDGADGPTSRKAGPAAAKAGNNPQAQAMEVRETHKELVYNYRQFIKESANKK